MDNAIKLSAGKAPESWYLLKMAAHYELKQYKPATEVLTALVDRYPEKKKYWTQLSAMHMQAGNDAKALAALEGAYNLGMLTEANELQRLANYLAFAGIPHRAARVMEKAMKEGTIESTAANYKTLANYWHQAKELDPAIDTLAKSYKLAPNAELQLKMARMMIQSKRYRDLVAFAAKPAANASGEQRADLKTALTGVAYFRAAKPARRSTLHSGRPERQRQWVAPPLDQLPEGSSRAAPSPNKAARPGWRGDLPDSASGPRHIDKGSPCRLPWWQLAALRSGLYGTALPFSLLLLIQGTKIRSLGSGLGRCLARENRPCTPASSRRRRPEFAAQTVNQ